MVRSQQQTDYETLPEDAPKPTLRRKMSGTGATFELGAFEPEMNMLQPIINTLIFFDRCPRTEVLVQAFKTHLWPHHHFNSCVVDGYWEAKHSELDPSYHFPEIGVADEAAIDRHVQEIMQEPLDIRNHPAWRVVIMRSTSGRSRSAIYMRIHHAIGDGIGLLFALSPMLGTAGDRDFLSTIPLPKALLPPEQQKMAKADDGKKGASAKQGSSCFGGCCCMPCAFCKGFTVSLAGGQDSELAINSPLEDRTPFLVYNGQRVATRFAPVPMDRVKAVCTRHGCTVNDAIMSALIGALRRYGAEVAKDERLRDDTEKLDFSALVMIGLPRPVDSKDMTTALVNKSLYTSCWLPIDEATPAGRLRRTKQTFENLKNRAFMFGLSTFTNIATSLMPLSLARKVVSEAFCKKTLLVTNVPGSTVPVTFPKEGGEVIGEVQMIFPNAITQVSIMTYNRMVYANVVADPQLIAEPVRLGEFFVAEFQVLAEAEPDAP